MVERARAAPHALRHAHITEVHLLVGVLRAEIGTVPRALAAAHVDRIRLLSSATQLLDERRAAWRNAHVGSSTPPRRAKGAQPIRQEVDVALIGTIAVVVSVLVLAYQGRELAGHTRIANEVAGTQAHRELLFHWKSVIDVFVGHPELLCTSDRHPTLQPPKTPCVSR